MMISRIVVIFYLIDLFLLYIFCFFNVFYMYFSVF